MIHETLLNLWSNAANCRAVASKFQELQDFLHPGEKKLLEQIVEIETNYYWIVDFCREISEGSNNDASVLNGDGTAHNTKYNGLYVKAFASGLNNVLDDYRNDIFKLENMFLENPQLPLMFVLSVLEKYKVLFQVLDSIIEMVINDHLHGCQLVGRLHKYLHCGVNIIADAAQKITSSINIIFYEHLCRWIIYGDLVDTYNEFFIVDGKCADENFLYPDQIETDSGASSLSDKTSNKLKPPPVRKFYINWNLVPIFLNEDTAESILFMGRIVWIVRNNTDQIHLQEKRDVWEGKHFEYYKKNQALETQIFDSVKFQEVIEECRIKLTQYLWSVMLNEGKLKEHLLLIRDYYALGRGELFNQFILVAENHIKDVSGHSNHNLNFIFKETARKIYGENDKTYKKFDLTVNKSSELSSTVIWLRLHLNFEVSWPLHIIFHPKSMELYNKLFCYLLRLKKTQIHLQKLWASHIKKQKIDRRVGALRQNLTFLVNNLQYYLQVDVIEAQFSILMKAVENANEFEDIIKVHHEFISNLLAQTFVLTPDESHTYKNKHRLHQMPAVQFNVPSKVYNVIVRLLELCDNFCCLASTWEAELTEVELAELIEFEQRTDTIVESLLFIVYSLHEKAKGKHLLQLLYQLDFNRYFSKNKPEFNLTVTS